MTQQQLLLQLQKIRDITGSDTGFYHTNGERRLTTVTDDAMLSSEDILSFLSDGTAFLKKDDLWLFRLGDDRQPLGVLTLTDSAANMEVIGQLAAGQFSLALQDGRSFSERSSFFAALLKGTCDPQDIPVHAGRLHVDMTAARLVYLIETDAPYDKNVQQTIRSLYPESAHHYLIPLDDIHLVLILETSSEDPEELSDIAETMVDMLSMEAMCNARVSCSTVIHELSCLPQALSEAQAALEVGKIFYADHKVSTYASLGIGRLIYQLPRPLCQVYLREIFGETLPAVFDEETLNLVEKFFENNLNTSEAARRLYIHRNTLIYRLDKIQKETGLDLRRFDDAIALKMALLVRCYLRYLDDNN